MLFGFRCDMFAPTYYVGAKLYASPAGAGQVLGVGMIMLVALFFVNSVVENKTDNTSAKLIELVNKMLKGIGAGVICSYNDNVTHNVVLVKQSIGNHKAGGSVNKDIIVIL